MMEKPAQQMAETPVVNIGIDTTMQAGIFMLYAGSGSQTYLISLGGTEDTPQSECKFLI